MESLKVWVATLIVGGLVGGCSGTSQLKEALRPDPLYRKALTYTQRGQLSNSLETKALVDATYLNPLYPHRFTSPTFLIGVYNDFENNLTNPEFNLTLNGHPPTEINNTIPSFVLYKNFPFYNNWMRYYLVKFPKTGYPLKLKYQSQNWGALQFKWQESNCPSPIELSP
ncbi:MAG: hypothetical protein ABGW77_00855 [Campylobacterales bacterium]